jgi:hypothetical protein
MKEKFWSSSPQYRILFIAGLDREVSSFLHSDWWCSAQSIDREVLSVIQLKNDVAPCR